MESPTPISTPRRPTGHSHSNPARWAPRCFGFGTFRGQYAMALVSRFPIDVKNAQDFSKALWKDFSWAELPSRADGAPFPSAAAQDVMRLSSKGHWDVPITLPDGRVLRALASHPTPPVFDGPEDMNGKRNRDEIRFWMEYLAGGSVGADAPQKDYVILGELNADPLNGAGANNTISELLAGGLVTDPAPRSNGAVVAAGPGRGV